MVVVLYLYEIGRVSTVWCVTLRRKKVMRRLRQAKSRKIITSSNSKLAALFCHHIDAPPSQLAFLNCRFQGRFLMKHTLFTLGLVLTLSVSIFAQKSVDSK